MASQLAWTDGPAVALRRDLIAVGFTDKDIRRRVARDELERVGWGALRAPTIHDDAYDAARERAIGSIVARASVLPSGVLSHVSAAVIHDLPVPPDLLSEVHLTRAGRGGSRRTPGLMLHAAKLDAAEIITLHGLPATVVSRTLVDIARSFPINHAVAIADAALNRRLLTPLGLALALKSARRRPGLAAAYRVVSRVDGRSESAGETELRLLLAAAGFPNLELQVDVFSEGGKLLGRVDAALLECAVLIEFDGKVKYQKYRRPGESVTDAVLREKRREEALVEAGFVVIRVIWADLLRPRDLAGRVVRAMGRGARQLSAGSVTGRCIPRPALRLPDMSK